MDVRVAVVADYASVDRLGKLSVNGIFGVIFAPSAPAVHSGMYLVFQLEFPTLETGEHKDIQVALVDADNKVLLSLTGDLNIITMPDGVPTLVNQILHLGPMLFERFGRYEFKIAITDFQELVVPITVARVQPGPQTGV